MSLPVSPLRCFACKRLAKSRVRRADKRDRFPFVSPVDTKIFAIDCDDAMARVKLAHANQAKISEIRAAIAITARQGFQLGQMVLAVESESNHSVPDHRENERDIAQVKRGLGQNRFASQQRFRDAARDADCPVVMSIVSIGEGDKKPGIGNAFHEREKPLRLERSFDPRTLPAKRMKACVLLPARALSN
jgi:hypothetical protein